MIKTREGKMTDLLQRAAQIEEENAAARAKRQEQHTKRNAEREKEA